MSEKAMTWQEISALEDYFMGAAEGKLADARVLAGALEPCLPGSFAQWPSDVKEGWESGIDLAVDGFERRNLKTEQAELLTKAMRAGVDTSRLRDMLIVLGRSRFSDYMDPAGMIEAIGIRDEAMPMAQIFRRWNLFSALREGGFCCHQARGKGRIEEIDGIANELHIRFQNVICLPLDQALGSLALVLEDSLVEELLDGRKKWTQVVSVPRTPQMLRSSLMSLEDDVDPALVTLLGGEVAKATAVIELLAEETAEEETETAERSRSWTEARSVKELVELVAEEKSLVYSSAAEENLCKLWERVVDRVDQAELFAGSVALLWSKTESTAWLAEMLRQFPEGAVWADIELFSGVSDRLPGRQVPGWFAATAAAVGLERLEDLILEMPLRLWPVAEKVLNELGKDGTQLLARKASAALVRGLVTADVAIWLWRSGCQEREVLADVQRLFRILARPVTGSYLRASHELRKMIFEDEEFQRFILQDGSERAISSMIGCIRHLPVLDHGERQSLLVRIVRLYPAARALVEDKTRTKVRKKAMPRETSLRSYELRRKELQEIINVKIPQNSRAIGHALSYGDLRENAEYKAAKEEQAYLGARRAELEEDLHRVRPVDFAEKTVGEVVMPGSTVVLEMADGASREIHVLGEWDSVPEKQMISCKTPVGELLVGRQAGAKVTLTSGEEATVTEIRALSPEMVEWLRGEDMED
jgi:transcription elongation GreA/GreB family factor